MAYAKGFRKAIQMAVDMGIISPVTPKSTPQPVDVTASTMNKKKYASIGTSQMRSGRYSTIKTSSTGLTSSTKTSKKKLLGE